MGGLRERKELRALLAAVLSAHEKNSLKTSSPWCLALVCSSVYDISHFRILAIIRFYITIIFSSS